jgi:glyoxylase-like metal-dependent hydrolase (beta-lactamase superfamily II)
MGYTDITQAGDHTYVIPAPVNVGIYENDGEAILIDSGNDKEAGRQILKTLTEREWNLRLIVNTHSNADHIGGNNYLQEKTGCSIAATAEEAMFIRFPRLEPAFLYGGFPLSLLRNKFLEAKPSDVAYEIEPGGPIVDTGLEAVPLPGHFFDMIGVRTPDNVLFVADSLFSERIIDKYHLFYIFDVDRYLKTLSFLEKTRAELFVPSHAEPARDISPLILKNREQITDTLTRILEICEIPVSTETIFEKLCSHYGIRVDMNQYVLVSNTVKSHLGYLADKGQIEPVTKIGQLRWQRV